MFEGMRELEEEMMKKRMEGVAKFGLKRIDDSIAIVKNSLTIKEAIIKLKEFREIFSKLTGE